jgi:hypothetical protein
MDLLTTAIDQPIEEMSQFDRVTSKLKQQIQLKTKQLTVIKQMKQLTKYIQMHKQTHETHETPPIEIKINTTFNTTNSSSSSSPSPSSSSSSSSMCLDVDSDLCSVPSIPSCIDLCFQLTNHCSFSLSAPCEYIQLLMTFEIWNSRFQTKTVRHCTQPFQQQQFKTKSTQIFKIQIENIIPFIEAIQGKVEIKLEIRDQNEINNTTNVKGNQQNYMIQILQIVKLI